jgi:hypothetical protein
MFFLEICNVYSVMGGSDESKKLNIIKIGTAVYEL